LIPYLASEFERIVKFKQNREEFLKYTGYNRPVGKDEAGNTIYSGEVFTLMDNVLTDDLKNQLLAPEFIQAFIESGLSFEEFLKKGQSKLKQDISTSMINYFNDQVSENIQMLSDLEFIDKSLFDKLGKSELSDDAKKAIILKAYTYNSWIHNFETINIFYGDPTQRNHFKENEHKRNTGSTSGGPKFLTDEVAQNFINNIWNAEGKTYASRVVKEKGDPSYGIFTYDGTIESAIVKDVERPSQYLDQIEAGLREDYKRAGKTPEQIEKLIKKDRKPYEEMNEADGAGYISFDAYRTLKKLENAWSPQQENLFQKIIDGKEVKASDVLNFFPVYKLQNYGHLANDTLAPILAMHKFALTPLIPSVIKGSQLEHLHKEMMRNGVQYMVFESGSKVGGITSNNKPDVIFADDEMTELQNKINFTKNTIYLEYLKVATNVNTKFKGKLTFPTQLRGLILDGMFSQGLITKKEFEELATEYDQLVDDYTEVLKLELLDEIGYEYKDGKYVGDMTKFLAMVQKELGKRDMPDHLVRSIGVNRDGSVKTDLSTHLEADTIEKMILAVITKRLIKQKVKGEPLIQVPSTMWNGLWDQKANLKKATKEEIKKFLGSNNLPFYNPGKDGTNAMKIAIALQGDYVNLLQLKHNDGEAIGNITRLNEMIKDDEWLETGNNRKAITLAGARIPIQNLNSMEFAEVYHFLDPSAGNLVVVPSEIVAKAGSDFDVDKIFWMMAHIDSRGEYVDGGMDNAEFKKKLEEVKNFKPKAGMKKPSAKGIIQKQKKALENQLINVIKKILSSPGNYASLVRPNETYLVKDTADAIEEKVISYDRFKNMHKEPNRVNPKGEKAISPTRVLEVGYNLHKHDVNMIAKDTLGIEALQNKKHPILKAIGAKMPAYYREQFYDNNAGKYVDGDRNFAMRLLMPHNTVKGKNGQEQISISSDTNVDGTRIADIYSHIMNGLLDVEANPWAAYIQANLETIGILNYLLEAGVPAETAVYFVSNPYVRDYVATQKRIKSTFFTLANKKTIPFQFVKSQAARTIENKIPSAKRYAIINKINNDALDYAWSSLKDSDNVQITLGGQLPQVASFENIKAHLDAGTFTKAQIVALYKVKGEPGKQYDTKEEAQAQKEKLFERKKSLTANNNYYDSAVLASQAPGVLDAKGNFDKERLLYAVENPTDKNNTDLNLAVFLHFIEIEKQIQGLESVKRQSNPDTKLLKTVQQVRKREQQFVDSSNSSKIDEDLPKDLREKSILKSFYLNDLTLDLIEPLLPMRLDSRISQFITNTMNSQKSTITSKFGQGVEGEERFSTEYNNAVVNFVFQNFMSNFIDSKGNIVEIPDVYRDMPVILKPGIANGVEFKDSTFYIDKAQLEKEYNQKLYLRDSNSPESYTNRGLSGFKSKDDPFPTQASYNRYVVEREFLRKQYPTDELTEKQLVTFEKFLNQRALINVFNKDAILGTDEFSYTDYVMKMVNSLPTEIKDKYPVLNQISRLPYKGSEKIIQLNDQKLVKGDLATTYYQNLRELGDVTVTKLNDPVENQRLSDVFRVFSLMMIHQHGVGYSKYGFVKALDDTDYLEVMRNASEIFMNQHLNNSTLSAIFNRLMSDSQFKDYVMSPEEFVSTTIPSPETYMPLKNVVDEFIMQKGEEAFNALMVSEGTDMTILDVPANVSYVGLSKNDYDDYVQVDYQTLNTMLNRLTANGINPTIVPEMFNDFATDTSMNLNEFVEWLKTKVEANLEEIPVEEVQQTQPEVEEPTQVESTVATTKEVKPDIPRAQMIFSYGKNKRPGVRSETTFDAIKNGERTATTRYSDNKSFNFWKKFKKGDIVEFVSDNGETLLAEITVPLHKLSGSGKTPNQWSELEGWSVDYFNTSVRPKLDKAYQIEYKYIPQETVKDKLETSVTEPVKIYVDGSDIKGTGAIGFGAVYRFNNKDYGLSGTEQGEDIKQLQEMFPTLKFSNPTMEMLGLVKTLESFVGTSQHLAIFQDYSGAVNYDGLWQRSEGSAQRAVKPWKAKEAYTKYLVDRAVAAIKQIEAAGGSVKLNWVKGHSGNSMNDLADVYAKDRNNFNTLTEPLEIEKAQLDASILKTSVNSGDYSVIEAYHASMDEQLISNLASLNELIDEYVQLYSSTMTQEQFVEFKRNCG
jgi:ribonuclease HI